MAIAGFLFLSWRVWEIVMTTPVVGMLGWLVHEFVNQNKLVPTHVLVLFIVSTLALAWEVFTVISYLRARHDAYFIAFTDICFFGAFIAGVVLLRQTGNLNCSGIGTFVVGKFRYPGPKYCNLLKASFAIGIILVISFFVTFLLALWVHHHHRHDDKVVVKREYSRDRHHGSRSRHGSQRDYRSSRDYDYGRPRSSGRRPPSRSRREWV